MTALDRAVEALTLQTRLAAACGAVGVPGVPLGTALHAVGERRTGPVRFGSDGRLDRLTVALGTSPDVLEDVLEALAVDVGPALSLVDAVSPPEVELRVTVTTDEEVTVGVTAAVDRSVGEVSTLFAGASRAALEGLEEGIGALELSRVSAVGVVGDQVLVTLAQVLTGEGLEAKAERLKTASRLVGSAAQASWAGAMLVALAPGRSRAPVTLVAGDRGLVEVGVTWDDVAAETVLRTMLALVPQERSGAVLGALAAVAGGPDLYTTEMVAHAAEPPLVRFLMR